MISKVVIFFNANISMPNFVWKFKQFFLKKNLPWLDHVYPTKFKVRLILVLNPRPLNAHKVFLTGAIDMLLSRLTPLPSLVGSTEPFTHRGAKVGSLKVKNHVSSCVGQQSNALP